MLDRAILTKRHILFDMDGTLVDSKFAILDSLRQAMQENGVRVPDCLSVELIGPPIDEIVRKADPDVTEDVLKKVIASFRSLYDSEPERGLIPYAGIPELLDCLRAQGFSLYVVTNKPIKPTRRILEYLGWDMFTAVFTPDSCPHLTVKRNKADSIAALIAENCLVSRDVLMVGDTISDVQAAHTAGIEALGVLWGYEKDKNRLCAEADYSACTAQDIIASTIS